MAYSIGLSDVNSINGSDLVFSTSRFLPSIDDIPKNIITTPYYAMVSAIFYGRQEPSVYKLKMCVSPQKLLMLINSHLSSPEYSLEHRIKGVAYMLSFIISIEG